MVSSPTEILTKLSLMPATVLASGVSLPCVVVAGWVMVVFTSPRFAVMEIISVASIYHLLTQNYQCHHTDFVVVLPVRVVRVMVVRDSALW